MSLMSTGSLSSPPIHLAEH